MATAPLSAPRPRLRSLACVWPLIPLRGSFLLAAHAYHAPPTGAPQIRGPHIAGPRARSEFVGCARILSTARSCCAPLSCETFRREPATRRFVWSFAPMPTSHHRVEHQNGSGPPPVFPPASASAGIVHRLSGPTATTHGSPPASALARPPRRRGGLLGPCFNTGPSPRRPPHFRCFTAQWRLFRVPSRYLCAIGLAAVFSLGCVYHPFALHYQAALLRPRARSGAVTRAGPAFQQVSCIAPQRPRAYHRGSSLFGRPYCGNPRSFLFLALMICLSPGRRRAVPAPFGAHTLLSACRVRRVRHRTASLSVPCGGLS